MNRSPFIIVIGLTSALLLVGLLILRQNAEPRPSDIQHILPNSDRGLQPAADGPPEDEPKADTSDWTTYRNDQYAFEIKYPAEYKIRLRTVTPIQEVVLSVDICSQHILHDCYGAILRVSNRKTRIAGRLIAEKENVYFYGIGDEDILSTFRFAAH